MEIRLASHLQPDSIVDGNGIRTVLWTQGCGHKCKGCHNLSTHDFKGGFVADTKILKKQLTKFKGQDGITLSGGDPFYQPLECLEIAAFAHSINLNVWAYTGFMYEDIIKNPNMAKLLEEVDILVDGKFVEEKASLDLLFKGSSNQRIIDVKKSLAFNKIVLVEEYVKPKNLKPLLKKSEEIFI